MKPSLADIWLVDPPAVWEALGFVVRDQIARVGGVDINLGADAPALAISGVGTGSLDGVPLAEAAPRRTWGVSHPNGVIGVDHFVIVTPDFERTAAACEAAGMPFRRVRDAGGFRQGFRRLGPAILEVVEALKLQQDDSSAAHSGEAGSRADGRLQGPARFWGITFVVSDLDQLAALLGERLRAPKEAVQPGRRIATLDRSAGVSVPVAFMTPESGQSRS